MNTYEECREKLESLIVDFKKIDIKDFNEATTRFRFIDEILTNCLNWELSNITLEDNYEGKYTDYTLNLFRSVCVVEAKKTGNYFSLPVGKTKLYSPIKSLYKDNKNIKAAIDQVSTYCHERSIPIAIICNGWQIIAFIANRSDSIPLLEGRALVVSSLDEFLDEFKQIWNCLSKPGFEEEYLSRQLLGGTEKELPAKLSSTIYSYPGIKNRNPFQTELEIISDLVLEDVIREKDLEEDFLKNCYCTSGALSSYSLVSKEILLTRYNYLFEIGDRKATLIQAATKKGLSGELVEIFENSLSKRPVLLVGDVGVGKSTFIDYLRIIEAPKIFAKAITFKIDLGLKAIISLDMRLAIISIIKEQLLDLYKIDIEEDDFVRHCYYVELERFKNNYKVKRLYELEPQKATEREIEFLDEKVNDEISHLKKSLEYICKSRQKQIIVFMDNCDQRSDQDQQATFLISQEFASEWPMIVFISLRPETFHRTKKESGALSGYHTKAFTIPPPRIDEVIKKRLEFAQKITSGEIVLSKLRNKTTFSKLHSLIGAFLDSLDSNQDLLTFLNNISNENIRKAIELIKKFFGSGHVDMEKIINIYEEKYRYTVPLHELLRAVIFGDNIHYSPTNQEIVNIFDVRHYNPNEHFILPIFLSLLDDYSRNSRNHGFISIKEMYSYMQGVGFTPSQIDSLLNFAYSRKLFETSNKGDILELFNNDLMIRITSIAAYHLRFLMNSFTYVDAVIVDTPIFNDDVKGKILNVFNINERTERAKIFVDYLNAIWEKVSLKTSLLNWPLAYNALLKDIKSVKEKSKKE